MSLAWWRAFLSSKPHVARSFQPQVEALEERCLLAANATLAPVNVRSIDGTGNNLAHSAWGSAGSDLLRRAPAAYGDLVSTPAGSGRPSARAETIAGIARPAAPAVPVKRRRDSFASLFIASPPDLVAPRPA